MSFVESLAIVAGVLILLAGILPAISFTADRVDEIAEHLHRRRIGHLHRRRAATPFTVFERIRHP